MNTTDPTPAPWFMSSDPRAVTARRVSFILNTTLVTTLAMYLSTIAGVEAVVGGVPAGQDAAGGHTSEVGAVASWA